MAKVYLVWGEECIDRYDYIQDYSINICVCSTSEKAEAICKQIEKKAESDAYKLLEATKSGDDQTIREIEKYWNNKLSEDYPPDLDDWSFGVTELDLIE